MKKYVNPFRGGSNPFKTLDPTHQLPKEVMKESLERIDSDALGKMKAVASEAAKAYGDDYFTFLEDCLELVPAENIFSYEGARSYVSWILEVLAVESVT